jgi:hypothetical protein
MFRRLLWSSVIAFGLMAIVMPILYSVYPSAENVPEASRTIAQQISVAQRNASFYTLVIVIGMLAWLIGWNVSNEFFRSHPSARNIFDYHRRITGIPEKYYKEDGVIMDNEAKKKAASDSNQSREGTRTESGTWTGRGEGTYKDTKEDKSNQKIKDSSKGEVKESNNNGK